MSVAYERYVAERFDTLADRFKAAVATDDVRLGAVSAALGPLAGLHLLDLGCGKGRFARHWQAAGADVIGIDSSPGMLAAASGLDRVHGSAHRLPFADAAFDAVIAIEVLEHLADVGAVLREASRVLRAGGRLMIVDKRVTALNDVRPWLPAVFVKWVDERRGRWMYPAGGPVKETWFWPGSLARELERAGFESIRIESLLRPTEAQWAVFRRFACCRLWTLWSARRPGGEG